MTVTLNDLEARAKAATPGEWTSVPSLTERGFAAQVFADGKSIAEFWDDLKNRDNDAPYIAAANPQTILAMIADLRVCAEVIEDPECVDPAEDSCPKCCQNLRSKTAEYYHQCEKGSPDKIVCECGQRLTLKREAALQSLRKWGL